MTTLDIEVATNADDGYLRNGSTFSISDAYAGNLYGYLYDCYFRFVSVPVPNGAAISGAYITIYNYDSYGSPALRVFGNDVDNAVSPTSAAEFNSLVLTTAFVNWTPTGLSGFTQSVSLTSIIAEITSRAGWVSGNALMLVVKNNSSPSPNWIGTYDRKRTLTSPSQYTSLHIEYSAGGGVVIPVVLHHLRQQGIA